MGSPINSDMDSFSLIIDKNNIDISTIDEVKCKTLDTLVDEIGLNKIKLIPIVTSSFNNDKSNSFNEVPVPTTKHLSFLSL